MGVFKKEGSGAEGQLTLLYLTRRGELTRGQRMSSIIKLLVVPFLLGLVAGRGEFENEVSGCVDGICLARDTCLTHGGLPASTCANSNVCCNFKRRCKGETRDHNSTFYSPDYPHPTLGNIICSHEIHIRAGICYVRLDFLEFNTTRPLDRGLCNIDQFLILNSADGPAFPRCGDLTGYSTIVRVSPTNHLPLQLVSLVQSAREEFKWKILVSQVKCSHGHYPKDSAHCLGKPDVKPIPAPGSFEPTNETVTNTTTSVNATSHEGTTRMEALENVFYMEYLKRAHNLLLADGPNPNANKSYCNNKAPISLVTPTRTPSRVGKDVEEDDRERIIRGHEALLNEFPWQVSIQDRKGHFCGGAVISETVILTASHCFLSVSPVPISQVKIIVGDLNLNTSRESDSEEVKVETVLFHSHFDPYFLKNDIAVIRLAQPLKFRSSVKPVCLPEDGNSYTARSSRISGWGAVHFPGGKLATHLQTINNRVIENSECRKILGIEYVYSTMLCAASPPCSGTCFGDSGGPLVVTSPEGTTRLVGIVSFGIGGCALFPYWPDVYTRVSEFLYWLSFSAAPAGLHSPHSTIVNSTSSFNVTVVKNDSNIAANKLFLY